MPSHTPRNFSRRYRSTARNMTEALDRWHSTRPGADRRKLWRVIEGGAA
jgi:hypothetical protein